MGKAISFKNSYLFDKSMKLHKKNSQPLGTGYLGMEGTTANKAVFGSPLRHP